MIRYKLAKISGAFASERNASRAQQQIIPTLGEKTNHSTLGEKKTNHSNFGWEKSVAEVHEQNQVLRLPAQNNIDVGILNLHQSRFLLHNFISCYFHKELSTATVHH